MALPQPGDVLGGKYRLETVLGRGGMGVVYAAHHEILAQRVAIKVLFPESADSPEAVGRFVNEARAAARIQSENVARVMDVGDAGGLPYIVMELLEGSDLSQVLAANGPLAPADAVDHVLSALEAIAQAHLAGIVHRDLKPANLFLARRLDGKTRIKVLDFGISKATNPLQGAAITSTKAVLGSPFYMSPEQLRSARSVDARTDIWSIGVILHELLAGQPPFAGESLGELFVAILEQEPPPLAWTRRDVPPGLAEVVARCMKKRADERFANVAELAAALAPFASARGAAAAQRIAEAMPVVARCAAPAEPSVPPQPAPWAGSTGASWGRTDARAPSKAPIALGIAAAAALVVLVVGAIGVRAMIGGGEKRATAAAASIAPLAPPPSPSSAPTSTTTIASDDADEPASSASSSATTVASLEPPAPHGTTPAPRTTGSAKPAGSTKRGCDPNFTLDAQGNKHFKPECF